MTEPESFPALPVNTRYASFSGRTLASIIDTVLSAIVLAPVFKAMRQLFSANDRLYLYLQQHETTSVSYQDVLNVLVNQFPSLSLEWIIMSLLIVAFWIVKSATPGKLVLRMKIVNASDFGKPTTKQWIVRYLGYIPATLVFGLGIMWVYIDKKRHQGWHDKLAGTVVIQSTKQPYSVFDRT